jgi:hypothetical protein
MANLDDKNPEYPVQNNPIAEDQQTGNKGQTTHTPRPKQSDEPTKKERDPAGF